MYSVHVWYAYTLGQKLSDDITVDHLDLVTLADPAAGFGIS